MLSFILGSALSCFDWDWRVAQVGKVVGAGAHVELAPGEGDLEALAEQVAAHPWPEFGTPFVEVHVGVQAAALLELNALFKGGSEAV